MSSWSYLFLGIFFEVLGTFCLKLANGFTHLTPVLLCFVFFTLAISSIMYSAKTLDISLVYAIWSGIGIVATTLIGYFYFEEKLTALHFVFIASILVGVIGLNLISTDTTSNEVNHVDTAQ